MTSLSQLVNARSWQELTGIIKDDLQQLANETFTEPKVFESLPEGLAEALNSWAHAEAIYLLYCNIDINSEPGVLAWKHADQWRQREAEHLVKLLRESAAARGK